MTAQTHIRVAEPTLPPLEEFIPYLEEIWRSGILTNTGPFHDQLEQALCEYLDVDQISLFANGTLALIAALKVLNLSGEVITTPFSFVATAHAIRWSGLTPVFTDIDPETLNLDPAKIEMAITPRTTAILPVHCYGRPCATAEIQAIANCHGLKVIYDAAHAFGVRHEGRSVLSYGDMSAMSFHATKVFNTFEGGAVVCHTAVDKQRLDQFRNFGITGVDAFAGFGINGKMNEVSAAFGLLQLRFLPAALDRRRAVDAQYRNGLDGVRGIRCLPPWKESSNYAYFPILVTPDFRLSRDELARRLEASGIAVRKYFFPLLSDSALYNSPLSAAPDALANARKVADSVLCLPMSSALDGGKIARVVDCIRAVGA